MLGSHETSPIRLEDGLFMPTIRYVSSRASKIVSMAFSNAIPPFSHQNTNALLHTQSQGLSLSLALRGPALTSGLGSIC